MSPFAWAILVACLEWHDTFSADAATSRHGHFHLLYVAQDSQWQQFSTFDDHFKCAKPFYHSLKRTKQQKKPALKSDIFNSPVQEDHPAVVPDILVHYRPATRNRIHVNVLNSTPQQEPEHCRFNLPSPMAAYAKFFFHPTIL